LRERGTTLDRVMAEARKPWDHEGRAWPVPQAGSSRQTPQLVQGQLAFAGGEKLAVRVVRAPGFRASSPEELDALFQAAQARGNEGLMIKDPESGYTPGRRGKSWLKLKQALATLDVVVTAVEYGHGKRIGVLSDYTFAVRDGERLSNIGKAYSGLTDAEISVSGQTATLRKNGWNLAAEIHSPRHAVFDVAPLRSAPPQAPNPGFHKLIVRLGDKVTELDLNIILTPYRDGQPKPRITAQFPA